MSKGILPGCGVPAVPDCAQASVPHETAKAIPTNQPRKNRALSVIAKLSLPIFDFSGTRVGLEAGIAVPHTSAGSRFQILACIHHEPRNSGKHRGHRCKIKSPTPAETGRNVGSENR